MEVAENGSFEDYLIKQKEALDWNTRIKLCVQICNAMNFVQEKLKNKLNDFK